MPAMKMDRPCVLLAAWLSLCVASPVTGQSPAREKGKDWTRAEAAVADHLRRVDPAMKSAEFASHLLRRWLPDLRVFVRFDRHLGGETRIFLVDRTAKITELANEEWRKLDTEDFARATPVMDFLKSRKLAVEKAEDAVEVAQLFEEVQGAANYGSFLHINTKSFTVFDKAFIEQQFGPRTNWKYTAEKREGGWRIKVEYVGPPASIQQPPTYEMDLDGERIFQDLRRY
jgi:hypothetical protein